MGDVTWADDWEERKAGVDCAGCAPDRPDGDEHGVRYLSTPHADAYLQRITPVPGYSTVVFRGRHVADPTRLHSDETVAFWSAVSLAARAIETVFRPCHLNFQLLGNEMPHVHVHIVPRYLDDFAPHRPLGDAAWTAAVQLRAETLADQVAALARAIEH